MTASTPQDGDVHHELRREMRTLSEAIRLVSSPLELAPILEAVVELTTEATDCHACFIYLIDGEDLVMRAASPVFGHVVGTIRFPISEGLSGWVARSRRPQFIRENAMNDPRMRYVSALREEEFQSMAAVPILARAGQSIGVIVLHTQAPREFADGTLGLLVHIASLVSGAIENAQLYEAERRRTELLAGVSQLAQKVAGATGAAELGCELVQGVAGLLGADVCQLLLVAADSEELELLASMPAGLGPPSAPTASELAMLSLRDEPGTVWPDTPTRRLSVTPLESGRTIGMLCVAEGADRPLDGLGTEVLRALAELTAVALERAKLIADLTQANTIKDLFEGLAAGAAEVVVSKAADLHCDLTQPYVVLCAETARADATEEWPRTADRLARELRALGRDAAVEPGPAAVRAIVTLPAGATREEDLREHCRDLGRVTATLIGISERRAQGAEATAAYAEAQDALTIARALVPDGGAVAYPEVGAYRYLVRIPAGDAPRDRMRSVVDGLIEYDLRRHASLLDTLERYLSERRSVVDTAQALYIHPNTLRQRLGRVEELTGLDLDSDDLLSLQLAIKLARLHGRCADR